MAWYTDFGTDKKFRLGTRKRDVDGKEYVYASPAYGYAQVALAYACKAMGKRATVFTAQRKVMHPRTAEAAAVGAKIVMVPCGYLNVVQARAASYAAETGATLLPFGLDLPPLQQSLVEVAKGLQLQPTVVWTVAGSGMLTRSLQMAWPDAKFFAVQVGRVPKSGKAKVLVAKEKFEEDAKIPPPFPSCSNYDAKAWKFIQALASKGALFWNVAA